MLSNTAFPRGTNTHFLSTFRLLLFYIIGCSFLLQSLLSCSSSSTQQSSRKRILPLELTVDSISAHVTNIDSLQHFIEVYERNKDIYGEMVLRSALGRQYQSRSQFMEAIEEHNRALILAQHLNDSLSEVFILNYLGESYKYLGVIGQAVEYNFRALDYCEHWLGERSAELDRCHISALNGIGDAQMVLGNYHRAEEAFRQALELETTQNNVQGQAVIYANLGIIKEEEGHQDSAFFYYERSLEKNRTAKSKEGIALCYNHFGRLAEANEDLDAALRYYYRAYYIMKDKVERGNTIESSLSMGRVYLKRGDLKSAQRFIEEGWRLADTTRSWHLMSEASMLESNYAERVGDSKAALDWYKKAHAFHDSVTNSRTRAFVHKLREDYIKERTENEMRVLRTNYTAAKESNRSFVVWAVMAGIFAILCIGILLFMLRIRMRSQEMERHMEKVRTDFFTNITHEFRTPLTVMLGLGKRIADGYIAGDEQECRKIGSMIVRQGNSLLDLVNQLLDIAKAESAIGKAEWRTGDIVPYISMIIENCSEFADMRQVSLAFVSDERELPMDFVPDYVRKVLQNLLTNAIKYSGEGGKVTVRMQRKGNFMQLFVTDTGRGIDQKDLPHIFDAFYTATNFGIEVSAGVGLAMVRQMVMAMKGQISVKSTKGEGTTFEISLPMFQVDKSAQTVSSELYQDIPRGIGLQSMDKGDAPIDDVSDTIKPSVLVVEDNRDVANYIGMQLTDKYRVSYAVNGTDGLVKANDMHPDLIVTDLMMPGMDGYELCRAIRKSAQLGEIPIIIVSAKSTETDRLRGLEAGANAYLFKPFNAEELQLLVANLVEQHRHMREHIVEDKKVVSYDTTIDKLKPHEREFMKKFVDVVYRQMPRGGIDAESLASVMCMSSSQLRRRIFACTGEKLSTYVLKIRLHHARHLLEAHFDLSVADIASRCGFDDSAYFARTFKNVYQMTPSQYRKQLPSGTE